MTRIIEALMAFLGRLLGWPSKAPESPISPVPPPTPTPTPKPLPEPPKPVLTAGVDLKGHASGWAKGTMQERAGMYQVASRVCQEEGLTQALTKDLLLTIFGESGFNQFCLNTRNKNGTVDYGLCQFNTGKNKKGVAYWIGNGAAFKDAQEVIDNPEKCVRVMAREFKAGHQHYWFAYPGRWNHSAGLQKLAVHNVFRGLGIEYDGGMSHTISAIVIQLAVVILPAVGIQVGSDQLTNLVQTATVILTGLYVWYRRVQMGDVTGFGKRKY